MKGRVQIVTRARGERWKFVAHGAPFTREEAAQWIAEYVTPRGAIARLLPLGKESK